VLMGRKGDGVPSLLVQTVAALIIAVFGIQLAVFPLVSDYYLTTSFATHQLDYDVYTSVVINSPECLAYKDAEGNVRAGIIDSRRINADRVKDCFGFDVQRYFLLFDDISPDGKTISKVIYLNENNYDDFLALIDASDDGTQQKYVAKVFLVQYYDGSSIKTGRLHIGIEK